MATLNAKLEVVEEAVEKKSQSQTSTYAVKKGDTLEKIAKQYNTTVGNLKKLNNLKSTTLKTGQKLKVPKKAPKVSSSVAAATLSNGKDTTQKVTPAAEKKPNTPKAGKIGTFGDLAFTVSQKTINTFENMSWNKTSNIAVHDRMTRQDLTEFLGMEPDTIEFEITFSVFLGVNPSKSMKVLHEMQEKGTAAVLTLGGKAYGHYKWVIQNNAMVLKRFDNTGKLLEFISKIKIMEYPKR